MKKDYGSPIVKICLFDMEDVITASVQVMEDDNVVFWPGTQAKPEGVFEQ